MIISAVFVKRPRKKRICGNCLKEISENAIKFFGHAEDGEKPYTVYSHDDCVVGKDREKIKGLNDGKGNIARRRSN
jgi:hypothetical protein